MCPCSGRPASVTLYPVQRPSCLPQSGKARPFCTKIVNATSRFGTSRPEINSTSTPSHAIVTRCGIRAAGGRSRSTASATTASGNRRQRAGARGPAPRSARRARPARCATSAAPRRTSSTRSSATSAAPRRDQRQRQRRLARARRRRESAPPGRRRPPPSHADCRHRLVPGHPIRAPLFAPDANANTTEPRSQQFGDTAARFCRRESRINLSYGSKAGAAACYRSRTASMLRCGRRSRGVLGFRPVPATGYGGGMHGMKTLQGAGRGQSADDARGDRLPRRGARALQPARARAHAGGHRARRGRPRPGRRLPRLHRPPHRPQPQGQVRRARALGRGRTSGGRTTPRWRPTPSPGSSPTCASTSAAPSSSCRTSTPAPTPPTGSTSASSPSSPGTASSSATCCAAPTARSSPASCPASPS